MKQTFNPNDFKELLHTLDQEYPELVGQHSQEPREDAIHCIADKLHLDHDVAREVLQDLETAGYGYLSFDPALQRDRLWNKR